MSRSRIAALVAGLLVGASTLTACSGSSDAGPEEPSGTSSTSSAPATPSTPSTPSTSDSPVDPPPETSSGPAAASGELVEFDGLSARIPAGWKIKDQDFRSAYASRSQGVLVDSLTIQFQDNFGEQSSLPELIEFHNDFEIFYERNPKTLEPVTIDGVEMFHLAGKVTDNLWGEAFGADLEQSTADFSFLFSSATGPAERQRVVDTFLASVDFE